MNAPPCCVGFKLPVGWRSDQSWQALLHGKRDALDFLARAGFDYIEYSIDGLRTPEETALVEREARACAQLGLGVALHPYLGGETNAAAFESAPECRRTLGRIMDCAARVAHISRRAVTVVLHLAERSLGPDEWVTQSHLFRQSRLFLAEVESRIVELTPDVKVVIENLPPVLSIIRIGERCGELLECLRGRVLRLCLDTGHHILAVERLDESTVPPAEFLRRVAHVHLHDVVEGEDHQPVTADSRRVACYLDSLWRIGYRSGITLEYSFSGIEHAGGVEKAAGRSHSMIRQWSESATLAGSGERHVSPGDGNGRWSEYGAPNA